MMSAVIDRVANRVKDSYAAFRFATGWFSRLALTKGTIRTQILIFCLAMSAIAAALGGYATLRVRQAGTLVERTFDESLMSINYARAAAADFAAMRVTSLQRLTTTDPADRARLDAHINALAKTLSEDLAIATERSQSAQAAGAAAKVQAAADAWVALRRRALEASAEDGAKSETSATNAPLVGDIDQYSKTVNQQVELLVNYTAGDGFLFRQRALAAVNRDVQLNVAGLTIALILSGLFAWLLMRRIIGPVAVASKSARSIASGDLNAVIPEGGSDELGTLLTAIKVMRDNIKAMVDREVAQRRSAQARLTAALESSREGVVLLDGNGQLALANSRANEFIRSSPELLQSNSLRPRIVAGGGSAMAESISEAEDISLDGSAGEAQLADGRWLRVSRSLTQEGGVIVIYSDITALKSQEAALHATNLRLDAALKNMSQGLCLYDGESRLQVVNPRFCEIYDISPELVQPGTTFENILALSGAAGTQGDQAAADLDAERARVLVQHEAGKCLQQLRDGRIISIVRRPTSDGGWLMTCEDVTEQRRAESQVAFMARHDALTKLPNRILFGERIEQAIAQAGRGSNFAVFCLDLDGFKQVNDTLGHPVGDKLLCAVADRLSACVREIDTVARLGGDEFAIIQCGIHDSGDAERLARRVIDCVGAPYELSGHRAVIGCSAGISLAPCDGASGEKLLKNADVALYRAKADGRGTWRFFEPAMDTHLQRRRALELDLREAMNNHEFELHYQPQYDLRLDRIGGFEALLRWRHPTRGLVPPDQFIPIAEEIGLITPLGEWVLRRACKQASTWPKELKIAVNVSAAQFRGQGLVEVVANALAASKLPAYRLELEITESVLLANNAETLAALHKLKTLRLRIALDDFGTGYSSLSYLRSFPFDKLKIDRSFIREATTAEESRLIVRAVISLGKSLGMRTIAEGVETFEQLNLVKAEGCNEAQGFLISRPVPAIEVAPMIIGWRNGLGQNGHTARAS
ncbi:diguanylate cyclase (GGDEF)-like protein [Bradyrhizobium sp. USDA 4524]|uniref:EAL domain-containing protein n=1 Tax=unclassified Bradyrhizobium TaxID=2631580 RepID=UPI00209D36AD|nr:MULTISPECIES: EAL domain-containing protein [unclassified Bradyrhizobium]MCP1845583.1 diguanylate cyclase (GGDEF)-like protein [Bradyrhizobium sp. USDA 4538]MCP1907094.1 diguanylate cyclase (GGDEF)-like protein [Bradyrhizobium sp. USDA 4537]MCP1985569.1 diguanylate cyclase (GGDEF)-like protein [Bradyrhizobium sp. USDA 4539]